MLQNLHTVYLFYSNKMFSDFHSWSVYSYFFLFTQILNSILPNIFSNFPAQYKLEIVSARGISKIVKLCRKTCISQQIYQSGIILYKGNSMKCHERPGELSFFKWMLTRPTGITSQCVQISNHYTVYLKLISYFMSIIFNKNT